MKNGFAHVVFRMHLDGIKIMLSSEWLSKQLPQKNKKQPYLNFKQDLPLPPLKNSSYKSLLWEGYSQKGD